jgi:CubicO group peptidase (beta-lactamase class C family)
VVPARGVLPAPREHQVSAKTLQHEFVLTQGFVHHTQWLDASDHRGIAQVLHEIGADAMAMVFRRGLGAIEIALKVGLSFEIHEATVLKSCDSVLVAQYVTEPEGLMDSLPTIVPRFAPQPPGVPWPTEHWPRSESEPAGELAQLVEELFTREDLAVTNAVLVIQGGRVLAERYGGVQEFFDRPAEPIIATSQLLSWSLAKSMLHAIIGTLVDVGHLDPDQLAPVPEWRDADDPRHEIRVRDLLAMRDGLDFIEEYEIGRESHILEMLWGEGKDDMAAYAAARPLAHEPGARFHYSSGTSNILSRIVADLVGHGDEYREYLFEHLFGPLGMRSAVATFDPSGVFVASSFVHAQAPDFAKFGLLYLRGGQWEDRQLLSRDWASTAQIPISRDEEDVTFYSWQWWVTGDRFGTYSASGYEGQRIIVVPALDAVIVRLGHSPTEHYPALNEWRDRMLDVLEASYEPS